MDFAASLLDLEPLPVRVREVFPGVGRLVLAIARPRGRGSDRSFDRCTSPCGKVSRNNRPSWSWPPLQSGSRPAGPSPVHARRHGTVGPPLLASSASPLRRFPSVRLLPVNQLPKQRAHLRVRGSIPRRRVPSAWSLTTSTVFSAPGLRVCCAPLPALGFVAFPTIRPCARSEPKPGTP